MSAATPSRWGVSSSGTKQPTIPSICSLTDSTSPMTRSCSTRSSTFTCPAARQSSEPSSGLGDVRRLDSTTAPSQPGGTVRDASRTHCMPALVGCRFLATVTRPTSTSPSWMRSPLRITPSASSLDRCWAVRKGLSGASRSSLWVDLARSTWISSKRTDVNTRRSRTASRTVKPSCGPPGITSTFSRRVMALVTGPSCGRRFASVSLLGMSDICAVRTACFHCLPGPIP